MQGGQGSRPGHKLDIGHLFTRSVEIYQASFVTFWLAVLALIAPGIALMVLGAILEGSLGILLALIGFFLTIVALFALVGVVVKIVEDVESDGRADEGIGEYLSAVAPLLGRLIILSVATTAVVLAGYVFLLIPGIIVLLKVAVAVPALFVERGHVFQSMARSAQLTRGNLLRVFVIVLVIYVAIILIQIFVSLISGESELFGVLIGLVAAIAIYPYLAIISAVMYFELRDVELSGNPDGPEIPSNQAGDRSLDPSSPGNVGSTGLMGSPSISPPKPNDPPPYQSPGGSPLGP